MLVWPVFPGITVPSQSNCPRNGDSFFRKILFVSKMEVIGIVAKKRLLSGFSMRYESEDFVLTIKG